MTEKRGSSDYILEVQGLSKSFGGTKALQDVELHIRKGEVHALVGENGAGKSTLMKSIIGLHKFDSGTITFEGKPYKVNGPAEAIKRGITMIHQELNPEPHLTVAENIFLHNEDTKGIFLKKDATNKRAEKILKEFDFDISPTHLVGDLTLAQAQMIEIMKAVSCDAKLVIMDEPTSSLDNEETERLFQTIRQLKEKGVSVVYISHRMEEIFNICDTVSVFRDGHFIDCKPISQVTEESLISMMVGREVKNVFPKMECEIGDVVFKVEGLTGKGFRDISFEVRRGEILGLTGLAGAGRSETMRAIFGLDPLEAGHIYLDGKEIVNKNPRQAIENGIAMVNEDRRQYGLCLYRSISENISLPNLPVHQKGLLLNKKREKEENKEYANLLTVKAASLDQDAINLSGGNQQKVIFGRWLERSPNVFMMDDPTRGIDVGAKYEIYELIINMAKQGKTIIVVSSEMPEILGITNRIGVMSNGHLAGIVNTRETNQEELLRLSAKYL